MKLTRASIAKLSAPDPSGEQRLYWDDELKGFGVLVSGVTATRSFVVQRSVNGRKRRVTVGSVAECEQAGKTIEDVRTEAANLIHDLRHGKDPKARTYANASLQDALDDYLKARPNLSEGSRDGYRSTIEGKFPAWLDRPLREITPDAIETRFHAIRDEVAARPGKRPDLFVSKAGAATANSALRVLRAVWHFAHGRAPDLPPWPASRFKGQWNAVPRRERHVRGDDLKTFFDAVNAIDEAGNYAIGRGLRDLMLLMLFTGFRRREASSLKWESVDFAAGVLRLSHKVTKSKRPLDLPMSDLVRDLLVARRALGTEGEYVFPGRRKGGHVAEPRRGFETISKKCDFPINPHSLRSTFLTVAAGVAMSTMVYKGLVNHAIDTADVTGGYVQEVELRKAAQAVARVLKRRCGIVPPRGTTVRELRRA